MQKSFRKTLLFCLCLLAALMLSACYMDSDPWPASVGDAPQATPLQQQPQPQPDAQTPQETQTPQNTSVQQEPTQPPQETQIPGGDEEPGING